jgi:hypothetical protein
MKMVLTSAGTLINPAALKAAKITMSGDEVVSVELRFLGDGKGESLRLDGQEAREVAAGLLDMNEVSTFSQPD